MRAAMASSGSVVSPARRKASAARCSCGPAGACRTSATGPPGALTPSFGGTVILLQRLHRERSPQHGLDARGGGRGGRDGGEVRHATLERGPPEREGIAIGLAA